MAMLDMEKLLRNAAGQFAHDVGAKLRGPKNNANGFAKTPANTFNDARKQLPRDRPCGIFVYVESASLDDEPMNSLVRQTVANFFRSSKRVNIVALLSETLEIRNGKTAVVRNAYLLQDPAPRFEWNADNLSFTESGWADTWRNPREPGFTR